MTPFKSFLSILSLFVVLGVLAWIYPAGGISIADVTFRFPALTDIFEKEDPNAIAEDNNAETDPQKAIEEMMAATQAKEFAKFSDSLKFYEDFFQNGRNRFDLPNNDPTWFDRLFLHLELAKIDSNTVHIVHYGDSQLEEDRISATIREDLQKEFGGGGPGMLPAVLNIPSQTTSVWNNGDLTRFIMFGTEEDRADHNRYGPLAQVSKLEGSAVIGIKKREDKDGKFTHVGGYGIIKVLASRRGNLRARLAYESTIIEKEASKKIKKYLCMMDSMTENELNCKDKIDDSRAKRIARGSGCHFIEVKLMMEEYKKFSKIVSKMGGLVKGKAGDISQIQRNPNDFMKRMGNVLPQNLLNKMGGTGGIMNMMKEFQNLEGLQNIPGIKRKYKKG